MRVLWVAQDTAVLVDNEDWETVAGYRWHLAGGAGEGEYVATQNFPGREGKTTYLHRALTQAIAQIVDAPAVSVEVMS